jgi:hypothetical protein
MSNAGLPIEREVDLGRLRQAGEDLVVTLKPEERARLATWAEVESVDAFEATIALQKLSQNRFKLDATLRAEIVQNCVVTLEPIRSRIERNFSRELHYSAGRHADVEPAGELVLAAGDDDTPEEIASLHFDLAAPLLEEFTLAIDPYPRAKGVAFEAPAVPEPPEESPFAVLKTLKK